MHIKLCFMPGDSLSNSVPNVKETDPVACYWRTFVWKWHMIVRELLAISTVNRVVPTSWSLKGDNKFQIYSIIIQSFALPVSVCVLVMSLCQVSCVCTILVCMLLEIAALSAWIYCFLKWIRVYYQSSLLTTVLFSVF